MFTEQYARNVICPRFLLNSLLLSSVILVRDETLFSCLFETSPSGSGVCFRWIFLSTPNSFGIMVRIKLRFMCRINMSAQLKYRQAFYSKHKCKSNYHRFFGYMNIVKFWICQASVIHRRVSQKPNKYVCQYC